MATNPMQRRSRNSFLLGMLVMLLIAGIIIGGLVFLLVQEKKKSEEQKKQLGEACILTRDVKKGTELSSADIIWETVSTVQNGTALVGNRPKAVDSSVIPSNAATDVDLSNVLAKIDLKAGTILTKDMLVEINDQVNDDLRIQEYNMFSLPVKLNVDDYIDIRLTLPSGIDYIVASKKRVLDIEENTIWLKVSEEEMLSINNAIVEAYKMTGAKLTVNLYVEPGLQKTATPTYIVSQEVYNLIQSNPNIVATAKAALTDRYNAAGLSSQRQIINTELNKYGEQASSNLEQAVKEEIESRKEQREKYLEGLSQITTVTE